MGLTKTQQDEASTILQRIRSKAIDTERLVLLDRIDARSMIERAVQIEGQANLLAMSVMTRWPSHHPGEHW